MSDVGRNTTSPRERRLTFPDGGQPLHDGRRAQDVLSERLAADRPLLAAALESETLQIRLRAFLAPLVRRPDSGVALLETLRAYIDTGCNCSSAASLLNVRRQTVTSRLRLVEELLGRQIRTCLAEIDTALRLGELVPEDSPSIDSAPF
jgi:DNA-binding PucR family transcriptional regulator